MLDSHLALPGCASDRDRLAERELRPLHDHADADAVMTAHVVYPALDPSGPATFARAIVTDLLRGRLGFAGVVITDALEMEGAAQGRGPLETAQLALEAGCDLLLFAHLDEEVRRARLGLARSLVDGRTDGAAFDNARPRLARLDRERPAPGAADVARPLDTLTPPDSESRLEAIVERGPIVSGPAPAVVARGPLRVTEPRFPHGAAPRSRGCPSRSRMASARRGAAAARAGLRSAASGAVFRTPSSEPDDPDRRGDGEIGAGMEPATELVRSLSTRCFELQEVLCRPDRLSTPCAPLASRAPRPCCS